MKNDLRYLNLQFFGGRGASSGKKSSGDSVRGVPQSTIDKLRGTRAQMKPYQQTWQVVQEDYKRVGINISEQEAKEIWGAVRTYTGGVYSEMKSAYALEQQGRAKDLDSYQKKLLAQYKLCMEYCKVAPTVELPAGYEVSRGIKGYGTYASKLKSLKVGDSLDFDKMPTSFSTKPSVAFGWAGSGGVVIHAPASKLKNTPAIMGMSKVPFEYEAFVADYNWKVVKIVDKTKLKSDGRYHIYIDD